MSTDNNSQYPQRSAKEPMSPFVQADQVMALYIPYIRVKLNKGEFGEGLCRFTKGKRWLFFQNADLEHIGHTYIFEATAEGGYVYRTTVESKRLVVDCHGGESFAILQKCDEQNVHHLQVFSFDDMQATWKVEFSTHVETGDLKKGLFFASAGDELFGLTKGDLVYQRSRCGKYDNFGVLRRGKQNANRGAWYYPQRPSDQNQIDAIMQKLGVNMRVPEEQGKEEKKNTIPLLGDGVAFSANADYLAAQVIAHNSPSRSQMMGSNLSQKLVIQGSEPARTQTGAEHEVASKVATPTLTKEEKVFLDYIIEQEKRAMVQVAYYRELKNKILSKE